MNRGITSETDQKYPKEEGVKKKTPQKYSKRLIDLGAHFSIGDQLL